MAFFNDLGKKISQTGQMAVQKTKDMADVAKLNSNITEEEKKINNAYYQIGQLFVARYEGNAEDEFKLLIKQLNESQKKIEELKKQIQDIKGVKRCATCGAEIPENATFCSFCGAGIVQQKAVDAGSLVKCDNCDKMVEKGMKFCTFCGSPIQEKLNQTKNKCIKCGAVLEDGVDFCTNCGTPVQKVAKSVDNQIPCPNCGENLENGMMFCTRCGTKFESNNSPITEHEESIDVIEKEAPITENNKPICKNCGAEMEEGSLFCIKCGTKIN